jgi:hypothetical protein
VFNEFTMRCRRIWPWRRDDRDPVRDDEFNEFYRFLVYLGSLASIETGIWLAAIWGPELGFRVVAYLFFGAWLLWRRPAMRRAAFWLALPFRGRRVRS